MAKDAQGNDLSNVTIPVTGAICLVPYDEANAVTREMISKKKAQPDLPAAYDRQKSALGLVTSDGGPQDSIDQDDAIEFWQQGYGVNADPTVTTAFTIAEDNDFTRQVCYGVAPDDDGVVAVTTLTPDTKWMAYYEETYKSGAVMRRAGVVQVTGNEPGQSERGSVKGRALTVTWQNDPLYENAKFIEALYVPESASTVHAIGVRLDKPTANVAANATVKLSPVFTPSGTTDKSGTWSSDDTAIATVDNGTVTGKKAGTTVVTFLANDGKMTASCAVTVTAAS